MKSFLLLFIVFGLTLSSMHAAEKKRYVLYATLLESTPVDLADGAKWIMDKGDTFPVMMFKEGQTKAVLQLAGTNFWVFTDRVKIQEENEITAAQLANYRKNVETYISTRSRQWKEQAAAHKNEAKTGSGLIGNPAAETVKP
jgi:hypothetical protein